RQGTAVAVVLEEGAEMGRHHPPQAEPLPGRAARRRDPARRLRPGRRCGQQAGARGGGAGGDPGVAGRVTEGGFAVAELQGLRWGILQTSLGSSRSSSEEACVNMLGPQAMVQAIPYLARPLTTAPPNGRGCAVVMRLYRPEQPVPWNHFWSHRASSPSPRSVTRPSFSPSFLPHASGSHVPSLRASWWRPCSTTHWPPPPSCG